MDLTCYIQPGWAPLIRPAPATRPWMDATPEAFAYRCLPLNIANAHGWELLCPHGFEATWNGGLGVEAITVVADATADLARIPVSLFGQGVLTFHFEGLIRTPPGWNLLVTGSPNRFKDAIAPLSGVIETDWSPFTFTMNWRFTRPGTTVRFEDFEPIAFFFPVQRGILEEFEPRFAPISEDADLGRRFAYWSQSRDAFQKKMVNEPQKAPTDKWQKFYYRGIDASGEILTDDHRSKLRLKSFDTKATPQIKAAPLDDLPLAAKETAAATDQTTKRLTTALAKRDWLLEATERQRGLSSMTSGIERRRGVKADEFLDFYYAPARPVVLTDVIVDWPALNLWTPEYLAKKVGAREIDYQGERTKNQRFERDKAAHTRTMPFDAFMRRISRPGTGNESYITAYNSHRNAEALAVLRTDLGRIDTILDHTGPAANGMMWIGPKGTLTALHHDLTNNLIVQVVGQKQYKILPPSETSRLDNDEHVFSAIADLEDPTLDLRMHPKLVGALMYEVILSPGDVLFLPFGWWHQVRSLSFSVSLTYTNFKWPNAAYDSYPAG